MIFILINQAVYIVCVCVYGMRLYALAHTWHKGENFWNHIPLSRISYPTFSRTLLYYPYWDTRIVVATYERHQIIARSHFAKKLD